MSELLGELFPGRHVLEGEVLRGSDRTRVRRVSVDGRSLIVKEYFEAEGWAREAAGLRALAGTGVAAEVVAESASPRALVLTDLGTGPSLSDLLLADDPVPAADGVLDWAAAVGRVHVAGLGRREVFAAELAAREDLPVSGIAQAITGLPARFDQVWRVPRTWREWARSARTDPRFAARALWAKLARRTYNLDYPLVGGYSDVCIVTAAAIRDFAHHCGVLAASGLFVEHAIPTALALSAQAISVGSALKLHGRALWTPEELRELDAYARAAAGVPRPLLP